MNNTIDAVDLFCGAGGLTHGLELSGIPVRAGYDLDSACEQPYNINNSGDFFHKDIKDIQGDELEGQWKGKYTLLAGCAPCQPFSNYMSGKKGIGENNDKWGLLYEFSRLVSESTPDFITMENVPTLRDKQVFIDFVEHLETLGYWVSHQVVFCADYGMPQSRRRLVLLASRLGDIKIIQPTHKRKHITVKDVISNLPPISAGESHKDDPLHRASALTPINQKRMRHSKPGGTWRDWPEELRLACHKKESGERYASVYGRMEWDQPSPTMTTLCCGYGNGRFGHPEQNRAISLREAALFQTFPVSYQFVSDGEKASFKNVGRMIGNAVPVRLGEVIGLSFLQHLKELN